MVTDIAEAIQPGRGAQQELHQPHKLAGNVGREGRETFQRALLEWREEGREEGEEWKFCFVKDTASFHFTK